MKNHDEFRRSVFEKAERYKEKRRKQQKMLTRTLSLCSLCAVIGISAYYAASSGFFLAQQDAVDTTTQDRTTENIATVTTAADETGTSTTVTTAATEPTATASTPSMTTTIATTMVESTTIETSLVDSTTETVLVDTTTAGETTEIITSKDTDAMFLLPTKKKNEPDERCVFRNVKDFHFALSLHYADRITKNNEKLLEAKYDAAFFERYDLVVVYVKDSWESYSFIVSDGMASAFSGIDMGETPNDLTMALHFYAIPKEYADHPVLISFTKQ